MPCSRRKASNASGAHCYESLRHRPYSAALADAEPGTFYLTDFLLRHFDPPAVIRTLGIDRHPELMATYSGNYRRLVYPRGAEPDSEAAARAIAERLGLECEVRTTGYGGLGTSLAAFTARPWMPSWPA